MHGAHTNVAQVWYVLRDGNRWVVLDSRTAKPERVKGTGLRREFGQIFVMRVPQPEPAAAARPRVPPMGDAVAP